MLKAAALAAAALLLAPAAWAHTEQAGDLQVVHPWVTPAKHGETATARPTLVNTGDKPIVIERITSPLATEVGMRRGGEGTDTLTIAPGKTLTPENLRVELRDLKVDLPKGKAVPIVLHVRGQGATTVNMAIGQDTMNPEKVVRAADTASDGDHDGNGDAHAD